MGNYARLFYHFVWATRGREPLISPEIETPLYDYLRHKCREQEVTVHAVNGMADHVHLACSLPTSLSISRFIEKIKGSSAHAFNAQASRENAWGTCLYWQSGYGALTFAHPDLPRIIKYVDTQKAHHTAGSLSPDMERCDDDFPAPKGVCSV